MAIAEHCNDRIFLRWFTKLYPNAPLQDIVANYWKDSMSNSNSCRLYLAEAHWGAHFGRICADPLRNKY